MGYYILQGASHFAILAANKEKAADAFKAFCEEKLKKGVPVTDGMDMKEVLARYPYLEDMLGRCAWDVVVGKEGDIEEIELVGEKLHTGLKWALDAVAPFVEPESFVEICGEDGEKWRWVFVGQRCEEVHPKVVWS